MLLGYAAEDAKPMERWHLGYKSLEETVNYPLQWVGLKNICKVQAEEIIYAELIYC